MATIATIEYDKEAGKRLKEVINKPFLGVERFWQIVGIYHQRNINLQFRSAGGRQAGIPKWRQFSMRTLHPFKDKSPVMDKWNVRIGTDGTRYRYSSASKLLRASGMFEKSFGSPFGVFEVTKKGVKIGTNHEKAKAIMSRGGGREVLYVTLQDREYLHSQFVQWYRRGLFQ